MPSAARTHIRTLILPLAMAALAMPGPAGATELSGKVALDKLTEDAPAAPVPAFRWELENGFKEVQKDRLPSRQLAVVLTGKAAAAAPTKRSVPISGGELLPSTVVMQVGGTLHIQNRDEIAHELFAEGHPSFSAEATAPRSERAIHLTETGTWPIRDHLVPHARGHLHVLSDLVATGQLDDNGQFTFADIQPGTYTLRIFHGPSEVVSQAVEVSGKTMTLKTMAPADRAR